MLKLKDMNFKNKKVLVRVDYNVPMNSSRILDDSRIKKTLPTLEYILNKKPKQIILVSHLGRPKGGFMPEFSLAPVAKRLEELLGQRIILMPPDVRNINLPEENVIMLENIRFDNGDENNDDALAQKLASFAEVFVFDAFGVSHRDQASVTGVMKYLKSCAGLLMEKEVTFLRDKMKKPKRPFVAIIGGAKEDKITVIDKLINKVDILIVGGILANTFLKAKGLDIGSSKFSQDSLEYAKKVLAENGDKIALPVDFILAETYSESSRTRCAGLPDNLAGWMIMDIGPYTISGYKEILSKANTIVWAGPIGVFEWEAFRRGTWDLANHIATLDATKIIGGGDSGEAIEKFGLADKMTLVSTGGGASLEMLSGKDLPAVAALDAQKK